MNYKILIRFAIAMSLTVHVQAGGLWLNEYGTSAQGRAGAGAQAGTGDAEIVSAKNPPVIGYRGEYNKNEILFFALVVNFPLGSGSR